MLLNSFQDALKLLQNFLSDSNNIKKVETISEDLAECFKNSGKALIAGNGGSACDAMHFAEEFTGRFRKDRPALPAISLTESSHVTCVGNDYGFNEIFARGVQAYGKKDDFFIGISTSGNSQNIIRAIEEAKAKNLLTFSLLGKDGGKIKGMCDYELIIPGETSDRIQEIHMMILHIVIEGVERILFPKLYE